MKITTLSVIIERMETCPPEAVVPLTRGPDGKLCAAVASEGPSSPVLGRGIGEER